MDRSGVGQVRLFIRSGPWQLPVTDPHAELHRPDQCAGDDHSTNEGGDHVEYFARRGREFKRRRTHAPIITETVE
ncbi:hypothetical protein GCM10010321_70610 [Streptomyces chartreusis]|nr:hypothetical protein GCM10010321_70610 [Streptomyces chartreusis]